MIIDRKLQNLLKFRVSLGLKRYFIDQGFIYQAMKGSKMSSRTKLSTVLNRTIGKVRYSTEHKGYAEIVDDKGEVIMVVKPDDLFDKFGNYFINDTVE